jgi:acetylornithine/N-succinyldiaminopimelate aminotransferase
VIAFKNSFHGRTSAAVSITDNPNLKAPINETPHAVILPLNDEAALRETLKNNDVCAIIIEGIQGIGGIYVPQPAFLQTLRALADEFGAMLIIDEIQSGYGRTGKFFAFQFADVQPDIITVAKGMGNGFPVAGVLIHPKIQATNGMLGSTFGGNQLACAASLAVLDVMKQENLMANAQQVGEYLIAQLKEIKDKRITGVRGRGMMIGVQFNFAIADLRKELLFKHQIFTGFSKKNILRLLPPLNLTQQDADVFLAALKNVLENI